MAVGEARALHGLTGSLVAIGDGINPHASPIYQGVPFLVDPRNYDGDFEWLHNYPGNRPYLDYDQMYEIGREKLGDKYHSNLSRKQVFKAAERLVFQAYKPKLSLFYGTKKEFHQANHAFESLNSYIVVEPNVKRTTPNKQWGFDRWQTLVNRIKELGNIVQLGPSGVNVLDGVTFIQTDSIRQAGAILANASAYVVPEGGMHHMGAAVGVLGVVIYGGYVPPWISHYDGNVDLFVDVPGSPCGERNPCDHCSHCMSMISVDMVVEALMSVLKAR